MFGLTFEITEDGTRSDIRVLIPNTVKIGMLYESLIIRADVPYRINKRDGAFYVAGKPCHKITLALLSQNRVANFAPTHTLKSFLELCD